MKGLGLHRNNLSSGSPRPCECLCRPDCWRPTCGHRRIEDRRFLRDRSWGQDRCSPRAGDGAGSRSRPRRFAIDPINSERHSNVAATLPWLESNVRYLFGYLRMSAISITRARLPYVQAR